MKVTIKRNTKVKIKRNGPKKPTKESYHTLRYSTVILKIFSYLKNSKII